MSPFLSVFGTDDNHVEGDIKSAKLPPQARRLLATPRYLARLDHKQIEVRVRTSLAPSAGTKEDHLRPRRSRRKATPHLVNQSLVANRHNRIVVAISDD